MEYNKKIDADTIIFIFCIIVILLVVLKSCYLNYGKEQDYLGYKVTDKAVKNYDDGSVYLVFTVDKDDNVMVFSIEDRFFAGSLESSDIYAQIEIGKTYDFHTIGVRSHLFSSYPSIISFDKKE